MLEVDQREQEIDQELQATALKSIKEDLRVELAKYAVIFGDPKPDKLANMIKDRVHADRELREKYSLSDFKQFKNLLHRYLKNPQIDDSDPEMEAMATSLLLKVKAEGREFNVSNETGELLTKLDEWLISDQAKSQTTLSLASFLSYLELTSLNLVQ